MKDRNKNDIIQMSLRCKVKIDQESFSKESFEMKKYFETLPTYQARLKFKLDSHMLPLAMNFRREKRFCDAGWICLGCHGHPPPHGAAGLVQADPPHLPDGGPAYETEQHVLHCWAYSDLREGKQMEREKDVLTYFQEVLKRRAETKE